MNLFRIHIRPCGGSADMPTTFKYCLHNGLLGVGYRTTSGRNTKIWDDYYEEASQEYKEYKDLQSCSYIQREVNEGDLVWTRDTDGQYYLARVKSGWEYWTSQEAIDQDIDIANIFRCVFKRVYLDEVPGKVVACFRPGRTIQKIHDHKAIIYSQHLWNKLSTEQIYEIETLESSDIFMMLDDEETEDLVFLYLQSKGWCVVPNSRKGDTMKFEFYMVNPKTNDKATTQVKTGNVCLNIDEYPSPPGFKKVFLFQSNELYEGVPSDKVICISRKELLDFLKQSITWLPKFFKTKMEIVSRKC